VGVVVVTVSAAFVGSVTTVGGFVIVRGVVVVTVSAAFVGSVTTVGGFVIVRGVVVVVTVSAAFVGSVTTVGALVTVRGVVVVVGAVVVTSPVSEPVTVGGVSNPLLTVRVEVGVDPMGAMSPTSSDFAAC